MISLCMLKIERLIHCQSHDDSKIVSELNDLKMLLKDGQLDSSPGRFHALEAKLPEELKNSDMLLRTQQLERAVESVVYVASSVIDSQSVVGCTLSEMNPHSFDVFSELMPEDSASNIGPGKVGLVPRKANDGIKEWLTGLKIDETISEMTLKGEAISEDNDTLQQGLNRSDISLGRLPSLPGSPDAAKLGNSSVEQDSLDHTLITLSRMKVLQNPSSMIMFLQDLVSNGVNLNAQDEEGLTAMHWASREGHLACVKFLCERGADVNLKGNEGQSALHEAVLRGQTSVVKLWLEQEAINIEHNDRFGRTPLLCAAQQGRLNILDALLKSNANLSAKSEQDNTALHLAAYYNQFDCVKLLLRYKAPITSRNRHGEAPLHMAASVGSSQCAKHLINAGAPFEAKDSEGYTALSIATENGHKSVLESLLQAGAKTDCIDGGPKWRYPLHLAASNGHNKCVKLLLDAGALPEATNGSGYTALMRASYHGQSEITKLLLEAGAKVDTQTTQNNGSNSLMFAAWCGHRDAIKILLAAGANIEARDAYGRTTLFYVMRRHQDDCKQSFCSFCSGRETRKDIMKYLCKKGADASAVDDHGYSLLETLFVYDHIDQDEKKAIKKILKRFRAK